MAAPNTLSIPPELMAQIVDAARDANQTPEEWAVEAMQRQLEDRQWRNLLESNERYVRELNIKESDVPDIVHQLRRERRRG